MSTNVKFRFLFAEHPVACLDCGKVWQTTSRMAKRCPLCAKIHWHKLERKRAAKRVR